MQVLIVDDNASNRILPAAILRKYGCRVAEAETGEKALQWCADNTPDCILLDFSMPGISGGEVCKQLRSDPRFAVVRFVAYTAHALPEECGQIMEMGFDALLIKPITRDALLKAVGMAEAG